MGKALALAAHGYAVFPCAASKAPACPGGFRAASTDPAAVIALFRRHPGPLIGLATGAASGVDVLDLDCKGGAYDWWQANHGRLPLSFCYETRSGGLHVWFAHYPGLRNSASRIAPGVDTRGDGGYGIFWPAAGCNVLCDAPPVPWPDWLIAAFERPARVPEYAPTLPVEAGSGEGLRYALGALRRAVEAICRAPCGGRNDRLNSEAFGLARFIPAGVLAPSEIAVALAAAGLAAGLSERETERTLASALRARQVA